MHSNYLLQKEIVSALQGEQASSPKSAALSSACSIPIIAVKVDSWLRLSQIPMAQTNGSKRQSTLCWCTLVATSTSLPQTLRGCWLRARVPWIRARVTWIRARVTWIRARVTWPHWRRRTPPWLRRRPHWRRRRPTGVRGNQRLRTDNPIRPVNATTYLPVIARLSSLPRLLSRLSSLPNLPRLSRLPRLLSRLSSLSRLPRLLSRLPRLVAGLPRLLSRLPRVVPRLPRVVPRVLSSLPRVLPRVVRSRCNSGSQKIHLWIISETLPPCAPTSLRLVRMTSAKLLKSYTIIKTSSS